MKNKLHFELFLKIILISALVQSTVVVFLIGYHLFHLSAIKSRENSGQMYTQDAPYFINRTGSIGISQYYSTEFEKVTNRRFGFYTYCPKTWNILIPENGDGYGCSHPENPEIGITVYGCHLWQAFMDLYNSGIDLSEMTEVDVVNYRFSNYYNDTALRIIYDLPSGVRVDDRAGKVTPSEFDDRVFTVRARRVEYEIIGKSGKLYRVLEKVCIYQKIVFTIHCIAPKDKFEEYRWLFNKMVGDFRVLTVNLEQE